MPTVFGRGARFALRLRVSVVDAPRLTPAFTVKLHRTPKPCRSAARGFLVNVIPEDGHGTTSCGDVRRVRADGAVPCGAAGARLPLKIGRDLARGGRSIILRARTK